MKVAVKMDLEATLVASPMSGAHEHHPHWTGLSDVV